MASIPAPTETDYRAWLAMILLLSTTLVCMYGMALGWSVTEILALLAFFGSLVSSAITYYFVSKLPQANKDPIKTS